MLDKCWIIWDKAVLLWNIRLASLFIMNLA